MDEGPAVASISNHTVGSASYEGSEALFLLTPPMPQNSALGFELNRAGKDSYLAADRPTRFMIST
jgi:hypothetical protein